MAGRLALSGDRRAPRRRTTSSRASEGTIRQRSIAPPCSQSVKPPSSTWWPRATCRRVFTATASASPTPAITYYLDGVQVGMPVSIAAHPEFQQPFYMLLSMADRLHSSRLGDRPGSNHAQPVRSLDQPRHGMAVARPDRDQILGVVVYRHPSGRERRRDAVGAELRGRRRRPDLHQACRSRRNVHGAGRQPAPHPCRSGDDPVQPRGDHSGDRRAGAQPPRSPKPSR